MQYNFSGEERYRIIKRILLEKPQVDNSGGWVTGVRDGGGELFAVAVSLQWVTNLKEKVMGRL